MSNVICPFDTCLYNMESECQRLDVVLYLEELDGIEFLECAGYEREE